MWYKFAQRKRPVVDPKKNENYPFVLPPLKKGEKAPPYFEAIKAGLNENYSPEFMAWMKSQTNPTDEAAGEGGIKNWKPAQGGFTNKGITQDEYDRFRKQHNMPLRSVAYMTEREKNQIYYRNYWAMTNADKLSPMVARVVNTYGLLGGVPDAAKKLQEILKKYYSDQPTTGNIYDTTVGNINKQLIIQKKLKSKLDTDKILADQLFNELDKALKKPDPQNPGKFIYKFKGYKNRMEYLRKNLDAIYSGQKPAQVVMDLSEDTVNQLNTIS